MIQRYGGDTIRARQFHDGAFEHHNELQSNTHYIDVATPFNAKSHCNARHIHQRVSPDPLGPEI